MAFPTQGGMAPLPFFDTNVYNAEGLDWPPEWTAGQSSAQGGWCFSLDRLAVHFCSLLLWNYGF